MTPAAVCTLATLAAAACALKTSGRLEGDAAADAPAEAVGDNLCPPGLTPCGEVCIDTDTSRTNCGACGSVCGPNEQCEEGACVCPLDEGALDCGGACIDPMTDPLNCGECGHACEAPAFCAGGDCTCPGDAARMRLCGGICVDIFTDRDNCGGCGEACPDGQVCNGSGVCDLSCTGDFVRCGTPPDEFCADLQSDPRNCSSCFSACLAPAHAYAVCDGGTCRFQCEPDWFDVDTAGENGCECRLASATESCDGIDENCDGTVDEGFECAREAVEDCSACGTRTCDATCRWGPCAGSGTCEPDEQIQEPCCGSGLRTMTCLADCTWGPWSPCSVTAECDPSGPEEARPCCDSGSQTRTCQPDCTWSSWGACSVGGVCRPGAAQCCDNNYGFQLCQTNCQWGSCTFCGDSPDRCCDTDTGACYNHGHPCPSP